MNANQLILPVLIFICGLPLHVAAQDFQMAANGVTITCEAASVGNTGVVDGVTYTKRNRSQIEALIDADENNPDLATTCTSGITDMSSLFEASSSPSISLKVDISNTQRSFNQDIGSWDVSQVTDMSEMFRGADNFNHDIGGWDVSAVTTMSGMFKSNDAFNQDIGTWDVSAVTTMSRMFDNASVFNQDIGGWDVSAVTDMSKMFKSNDAFNQDIGNWDVSAVTTMSGMFDNASVFNQDIGGWDVSAVTNMREMFDDEDPAPSISLSTDVSKETDMSSMSADANVFNQDIGSWDVSSVTNMISMFRDAGAFNQDLSNWCVERISSKPSEFNVSSGFEGQSGVQPPWGRCRSAGMNAGEGFRLLSLPTGSTGFDDLVGPLWTQGIATGADAANGSPNVWSWDKASTDDTTANWQPVTDLTAMPGEDASGFLMFVFEDDNFGTPGIQGGFPKTIAADNFGSAAISPTINANIGGFTLLGNPYDNTIDFDDLTLSDVNTVVYVRNPATDAWITWNGTTGDLTGGLIAPLQGFFVETMGASSPSVDIEQADKATGGQFRGKTVEDETSLAVRLELNQDDGELTNSAWLSFSEQGSTGGRVRGDALKLAPLSGEFAQLASTKPGGEELLDINHLPAAYERPADIPVEISSTASGTFTLAATDFSLPEGISLTFNNHISGESFPVGPDFETTLSIEAEKQPQTKAEAAALLRSSRLKQTSGDEESAAYSITIEPNVITSTGEEGLNLPEKVKLDQNFPNPFNPTTTIRFALPESQQVSLEVYDLLGRRVARLLRSEVHSGGTHSVNFDASRLSSGVYIYRLHAEGGAGATITRKLTLIK